MFIIPIRITFATSIKHTTKIRFLIDKTKFNNPKIINEMEKQIEKLKAELQKADNRIKELEAENLKVNELLDKTIKSLETSVTSLETAEQEIASLKKRKDEYSTYWSNECRKNKELRDSLKAVATLINTILA